MQRANNIHVHDGIDEEKPSSPCANSATPKLESPAPTLPSLQVDVRATMGAQLRSG
jgi:hypothetical protein